MYDKLILKNQINNGRIKLQLAINLFLNNYKKKKRKEKKKKPLV